MSVTGVVEDPHDRFEQVAFILLDNHAQALAVEHDQGAGRIDADGANESLHQFRIEMVTAPLKQLLQGLRRRHALVVDTLRGNRIVDIDDRRHLTVERDLLAVELARIAGAIEALVVLPDDIHRDPAHGGIVLEQQDALGDMTLHPGEFVVAQLGRLVEDTVGNRRLADIVQKPPEREFLDDLAGQLHATTEGDQQGADTDRMFEGVVVMVLQVRQRQQRILVAEDGIDDPLDQRLKAIDLDLLTEPDILHHVPDNLVGLALQAFCPHRLVVQPDLHGLLGPLGGDFLQPAVEIGADLLLATRLPDVRPLDRIDIQFADAKIENLVDRGLVAHMECVAKEGMIEPATIQVVDVHAWLELVGTNLLDHIGNAWRIRRILAHRCRYNSRPYDRPSPSHFRPRRPTTGHRRLGPAPYRLEGRCRRRQRLRQIQPVRPARQRIARRIGRCRNPRQLAYRPRRPGNPGPARCGAGVRSRRRP